MNDHFQDLSEKHDLLKVRALFLSSAICSPIFYFFMQYLEVGSIDSFSFRIFNSIFSLIGLLITFFPPFKYQKKVIFTFHNISMACWAGLYLYLLHVNHWTIFQRWSYFVLIFILCGSAFSWKDYLIITFVAVISPAVLGFFSNDVSNLELIHFHAAMLAPLVIIGFSIKAHFHFKNEVSVLTNSLIEKSQVSVLGEVAAGVSHEVNSPLMIFSYSLHQLTRQLAAEKPDREKINALTQKMHRMILRISDIVNALKVYSVEKTDGKTEKVDILNLIDESLALCNRKFIDQEITVQKNNQASEIICLVKKPQIVQCFLNLFNNSIEACQNIVSPQIIINASIKETYAFISITDNGNGVSEELATKIMNPFFTTKEIGTGLGLSVSQGIARGHQGELFLDRSLKQTTFVLKLPLA